MNVLATALAPLRSVLGAARREAEEILPVDDIRELLPVRQIEQIQQRALGTVEAIKDATESIESHVAVIETLASSVPPLTEAVKELNVQLTAIVEVLAPMAAVEHEVSRFGRLFGRHHPSEDSPAEPAGDSPAEPAERSDSM